MSIKLFIILVFLSYIYGSILFAIPITRIFTGKNIKKIGNTNPGTANVYKNVGILPGILVFILDTTKSLIPLLLIEKYIYLNNTPDSGWLILTFIGLAAVLGHTRPFWNKFQKGGGGMGTAIGIYLFLMPFEYFVAFVVGFIITFVFMKNSNYKVGRWVTLFAAVLTPIFGVLTSTWFNITICSKIKVGNYPIQVLISPIFIIILLFILNSHELFFWIKNPKSKINPR